MVNERNRFQQIADKKSHKISWVDENLPKISDDEVLGQDDEIHLDLNMLNLSITIAIERLNEADIISEARNLTAKKLQKLLESDDDAEKANFVFGSSTYYFREDLQMMSAQAQSDEFLTSKNCQRVCELISYPVCRCLCKKVNAGDCEQICREMSRTVCSIICD
jgi:hypothetical protein